MRAYLGTLEATVCHLISKYALPFVGQHPNRRYPRSTLLALLSRQRRRRGLGPSCVAEMAMTARRFSAWLARRCGWAESPLDGLEGGREFGGDHRHERRALTVAELERFLSTVKDSQRVFRGPSGRDRWALYITALSTGFRRGEVAHLTPSLFDLGASPPVIYLPDRAAKNGRGAPQPVPQWVAGSLAEYLRDRPAQDPAWPGPWRWDAAHMQRLDLRDAGIPYVSDGPDGPLFADFHALRHTFIAMLDRAGVTLKQAMQLARHSDPKLTLRVYGRARMEELGEAVNRLNLEGG
jgi:integrase